MVRWTTKEWFELLTLDQRFDQGREGLSASQAGLYKWQRVKVLHGQGKTIRSPMTSNEC